MQNHRQGGQGQLEVMASVVKEYWGKAIGLSLWMATVLWRHVVLPWTIDLILPQHHVMEWTPSVYLVSMCIFK